MSDMMGNRADLKQRRRNSAIVNRIRRARHKKAVGNTYQNEKQRRKEREKEESKKVILRNKKREEEKERWRGAKREGDKMGSPVSARFGDRLRPS